MTRKRWERVETRDVDGRTEFDCGGCGTALAFSTYVYAHWDVVLVHTCPKCDAHHEILRGRVCHDSQSGHPAPPTDVTKWDRPGA